MKNQNFADRLNACLDKEGFPPKNRGRIQLLAEMFGLSHRGASKWVNGESTPPQKKFADVAEKLNANEHWLKTGEGSMEKITPNKVAKDCFSIEVNIYSNESLLNQKKIVLHTVNCTLSHEGLYFGIILDTEAMSPRFPKGSTIIFEKTEPKDGDFVLINYEEFPVPIFRQLLIMGQTQYLNAHNPKFERLILPDSRQIIGKLVQAILLFD